MNLIKYIKSKFAKKSYTELAEEILSQSNFDSNIEIIIPADIDDKLITSTNNQIILIGVKEKNNIIIKEIIQKENPIGKLDEVINSENAVAFLFNIAENADTFYTNEQLGELIKLSNNLLLKQ